MNGHRPRGGSPRHWYSYGAEPSFRCQYPRKLLWKALASLALPDAASSRANMCRHSRSPASWPRLMAPPSQAETRRSICWRHFPRPPKRARKLSHSRCVIRHTAIEGCRRKPLAPAPHCCRGIVPLPHAPPAPPPYPSCPREYPSAGSPPPPRLTVFTGLQDPQHPQLHTHPAEYPAMCPYRPSRSL